MFYDHLFFPCRILIFVWNRSYFIFFHLFNFLYIVTNPSLTVRTLKPLYLPAVSFICSIFGVGRGRNHSQNSPFSCSNPVICSLELIYSHYLETCFVIILGTPFAPVLVSVSCISEFLSLGLFPDLSRTQFLIAFWERQHLGGK